MRFNPFNSRILWIGAHHTNMYTFSTPQLAKHKPSRLGQEKKCGSSLSDLIVKLSGITSRGSVAILVSNCIIAQNIPSNYDSDVRPDVFTTFQLGYNRKLNWSCSYLKIDQNQKVPHSHLILSLYKISQLKVNNRGVKLISLRAYPNCFAESEV